MNEQNIRPAIKKMRDKIENGDWVLSWSQSRVLYPLDEYAGIRFSARPNETPGSRNPGLEAFWSPVKNYKYMSLSAPCGPSGALHATELKLTKEEQDYLFTFLVSQLPERLRKDPVKAMDEERLLEFEEKYLNG